MSSFFGLNVARLGMQAQQKALDVTAHNVANANTPGYSRQIARMVTTAPIPVAGTRGMMGSGVKIADISRIRDSFLDMQIRHETQTLGRWEAKAQILDLIERVFMEPSETGFNSILSKFFDSWQELSLNPESTPVRAALVENATHMVNSIKHINEQLKTIRSDIDETIRLKVMEINTYAEQIKNLNIQITRMVSVGDIPSDLMDRRDLLIDELSKIVQVTALETDSGAINIFLGGRALVREGTVNKLTLKPDDNYDGGWPPADRIVWERDESDAFIGSGTLRGLLDVRNENLRGYMESFESMAWGIVNAVNQLHGEGMNLQGQQGEAFFVGDHLETLSVNPVLRINPGKIAASAIPADWDPANPKPNPGDGTNALRIAQLRHTVLVFDPEKDIKERLALPGAGEVGTTTLENYYRDVIARLGVDAQESNRMVENQEALLELMIQRRDSISGVSLDEEMANMIQFQLAFQASARMITTIDELLDTVINRMLR